MTSPSPRPDLAPIAATPQPWPHDEELHGWWVRVGWLLACEYPGTAQGPVDPAGREAVRLLEGAGIRTIVDLTEPDELRPYDPGALTHRRFGVRDMSVAPDHVIAAVLDLIDDEHRAGRAVAVHCWGGIGRTGTIVGAHLRRHGFGGDEALERIALLRTGSRKARRRSPETGDQCDAVRAWWG